MFGGKNKMLIKKILDVGALVSNIVLNTKTGEIENKTPTASGLEATNVLDTKIEQVENIISGHFKYITTPEFNS